MEKQSKDSKKRDASNISQLNDGGGKKPKDNFTGVTVENFREGNIITGKENSFFESLSKEIARISINDRWTATRLKVLCEDFRLRTIRNQKNDGQNSNNNNSTISSDFENLPGQFDNPILWGKTITKELGLEGILIVQKLGKNDDTGEFNLKYHFIDKKGLKEISEQEKDKYLKNDYILKLLDKENYSFVPLIDTKSTNLENYEKKFITYSLDRKLDSTARILEGANTCVAVYRLDDELLVFSNDIGKPKSKKEPISKQLKDTEEIIKYIKNKDYGKNHGKDIFKKLLYYQAENFASDEMLNKIRKMPDSIIAPIFETMYKNSKKIFLAEGFLENFIATEIKDNKEFKKIYDELKLHEQASLRTKIGMLFSESWHVISDLIKSENYYKESNIGNILLKFLGDTNKKEHAEMKVLFYLLLNKKDYFLDLLEKNETAEIYIGVSKKCCPNCEKIIEIFNKLAEEQKINIKVFSAGGHTINKNWTLPSQDDFEENIKSENSKESISNTTSSNKFSKKQSKNQKEEYDWLDDPTLKPFYDSNSSINSNNNLNNKTNNNLNNQQSILNAADKPYSKEYDSLVVKFLTESKNYKPKKSERKTGEDVNDYEDMRAEFSESSAHSSQENLQEIIESLKVENEVKMNVDNTNDLNEQKSFQL